MSYSAFRTRGDGKHSVKASEGVVWSDRQFPWLGSEKNNTTKFFIENLANNGDKSPVKPNQIKCAKCARIGRTMCPCDIKKEDGSVLDVPQWFKPSSPTCVGEFFGEGEQ